MKTMLFLVLLAFFSYAAADEWVNGYYRSDGTYVQGHYRSSPNQYKFDNYSSQGNSNPYTGEKGYKRNEFSDPPSYNKSYPYGDSDDYGSDYFQ